MNTTNLVAHLAIIVLVSVVGLSLVTRDVWCGVCYAVFAIGGIALWWGILIAIGCLPYP